MRFFEIVVSGAALISSALAVTIDTYPSGVEAGKSYTVTYSPKDQPATFILRKGDSENLDTVGTIGTGTGGSFTWTVANDLPNDSTYALMVEQGEDVNYTKQFSLTGGSAAVSSVQASASSALASASAALSSGAASASAAASSAAASASSAIASVISKASSVAASATIIPSASMNGTVSSATLSRTASVSATSKPSSTSGGPAESTGAASALDSSPLALVFGAIAAFAYLH